MSGQPRRREPRRQRCLGRSWTFVSNAAPVNPSVPWASIWPRSRANFWPNTGIVMARLFAPGSSATSPDLSPMGQPIRPCSPTGPSLPARFFLKRSPPPMEAPDLSSNGADGGRRRLRRALHLHRTCSLFNDTFLNHYHPEIGVAAVEVLERGGFAVNAVKPGCCGRPLISQGLLTEARGNAAEPAGKALHPRSPRAAKRSLLPRTKLPCRPLKEDLPSLLRGEQQKMAKPKPPKPACSPKNSRRISICPLRQGPSNILVHGHCHQKSMGLLPATMKLLARVPGATVTDLDAGCCGMAGSFGYSRDHYDVSVTIANRKLLPAVREMKPGDVHELRPEHRAVPASEGPGRQDRTPSGPASPRPA